MRLCLQLEQLPLLSSVSCKNTMGSACTLAPWQLCISGALYKSVCVCVCVCAHVLNEISFLSARQHTCLPRGC